MQFVVSARGGASASVDAPNWLAALGVGLDQLGAVAAIDRLACEVLMNGTVLVRDARSGEGYVVRPLQAASDSDATDAPTEALQTPIDDELPEYDDDSELIEGTLVEEPTSDEVLHPGLAAHDDYDSGMGLTADQSAAAEDGNPGDEDDITDRFAVGERPDMLFAGLSAITDAVSVGQACEAALMALQQVVSSESGSVLLTETTGGLRFAAVTGPSAVQLLGSVLPHQAGIAGFVIERATGLIVRNTHADPRFYSEVDRLTGYRTRSVLCVPLGPVDQPLGCIQLLNPPTDRRFEPPDLRLAHDVAEALSAWVVRERLSR